MNVTVPAAGSTTRVDVTQADIMQGEAENCRRCPIALALERIHPGSGPYVDNEQAALDELHLCACLPAEAVRFIDAFDSEQPVRPFSFDLTWDEQESLP